MFAQIPVIHSYTRILIWTIAFAIGLLSPLPRQTETLGDNECYGLGNGQLQSCQGLNPNSEKCDGITYGNYFSNGGARLYRRYSTECNSKWTKIVNMSGQTRYTAGCTRYGGSHYDSAQCVESGGWPPNSQPIASGLYVYTPMVGLSGTPAISCGYTSTNSIPLPITASPPNYYGCSGSW
ncbi:MAG: DUF2690 domain-containing protein [Anaerolineales bacterium]|nr:DUF2690 domain-containing protein [Anaerolineales bacterium]